MVRAFRRWLPPLCGLVLAGCDRPDPGKPASPAPAPLSPVLAFSSGQTPTNVLFVSVDTTRRDRIGRFSGRADTTPFLDSLLAAGVSLDDHRSCSNWTAPSMLCATTGHSPLDLGFWPSTGDPQVPDVPAGLPTVARALGDIGFRSRLVTANRVFSDAWDTAQGFDQVVTVDQLPAPAVRDAALVEVDALMSQSEPWLLHVHFFDPHREYCAPADYLDELDTLPEIGFDLCDNLDGALDAAATQDAAWQEALLARIDASYRAELRFFDDTLAGFWAELDRRGALDDTLVVLFSDHGEQHLERGVVDHGFHLYAEENRVFAGFWAKTLAGRAWPGPTSHTDLARTVTSLYPVAPVETATGVPLGDAPASRVRRTFAYSRVDTITPELAVVAENHLLLRTWDGAFELYDTEADPEERDNRWPVAQDAALEAELTAFTDDVIALWPHLAESPP